MRRNVRERMAINVTNSNLWRLEWTAIIRRKKGNFTSHRVPCSIVECEYFFSLLKHQVNSRKPQNALHKLWIERWSERKSGRNLLANWPQNLSASKSSSWVSLRALRKRASQQICSLVWFASTDFLQKSFLAAYEVLWFNYNKCLEYPWRRERQRGNDKLCTFH